MKTSPQLLRLFLDLAKHLKEMFKELNTAESISVLQMQALKFIGHESTPTMKDIASFFSITPASATSLINSLVDSAFITRLQDQDDRRIVKLSLTAKGQETMQKMKQRTEEHLGAFLSKLSPEEQKSLTDIFEKLLSK